MVANFDYYYRFESPIITLCNLNGTYTNNRVTGVVGILDNIKNFTISPEFNATSEMSCDIYKYGEPDDDGNKIELPCYDKIRKPRQLFIENVGFFNIQSAKTVHTEDGLEYTSVVALSCENEISRKKLNYFNGTYQFYNTTTPNNTLMGQIFNSLARWTLGHVDEVVANKYRTFEVPDDTVYSFLMNDVEEAYECLFEFDIINRVVDVYDKNNYVRKTTVQISKEDVIKSIQLNIGSKDIYCSLSVYGVDDLAITGVNPLGTNVLYNFDYYKTLEWMSQGLIDAINIWKTKMSDAEDDIATYHTTLATLTAQLQTIQAQMDLTTYTITLKEKQLGVASADPVMVASINAEIDALRNTLTTLIAQWDAKTAEITTVNGLISDLVATISFENCFTVDEFNELYPFMEFESTYKDENITVTDTMTYAEKQAQVLELYNMGKSILKKVSEPIIEISADTDGFIFQKAYQAYTTQLKTGSLIDIELANGEIMTFILLKMEINYEDQSFNMTFGNRYRTTDSESLFTDFESKVSSSASTLDFNKEKYGLVVDSGTLTKVEIFMNSAMNLTLNEIKSADGVSITLTDSGLHGRHKNEQTGEIDPEELWMTGNRLLFTDDNWSTIKTAVGKIFFPDGSYKWGISAEFVYGKYILGQQLMIETENGRFTINGDGLVAKNLDGTRVLTINPNQDDIFSYAKSGVKKLFIGEDGELNVSANIKVGGLNNTDGKIEVYNADGTISSTFDKDGVTTNKITITGGLIQSSNYVLNTSGTKIDLANGSWDSKYTKINSEGKIICNDFESTSAKITGGSINVTTASDTTSVITILGNNLKSQMMAGQLSVQNSTNNEGVILQGKGVFIQNNTGVAVTTFNTDGSIYTHLPDFNGITWAGGAKIYSSGAQELYLCAGTETNYFVKLGVFSAGWAFAPYFDGWVDSGAPDHKWRDIYSQNGTIITSDRNLKTDIVEVNKDLSKDIVMSLTPCTYKMLKGTSDRTHYGLIAQDVEDALVKLGIDIKDFAGLIKSPKYKSVETEIINENGETIKTMKDELVEGEYSYSLRYDEFISPIISFMQLQEERITKLESMIS